MNVSKVNNHMYSPAFQRKEKEGESDHALKINFANCADEELMQMASYQPLQDFKRVSKSLFATMLVAVPAIDTASTGLLTRGNLSSKLKNSALQAGRWGAVLAAGLVLFGIKKAVNERSPELKNINDNHPGLSFCTDFLALLGGYMGLKAVKNGVVSMTKETFPQTVKNFKINVLKPLKTSLNSTYLNTKMILPAEKHLYKSSSALGRGLGIGLTLLAPTVAVAAILKSADVAKQKKAEIRENYGILKFTRDSIRAELDDIDEFQDSLDQ